MTGASERQPSSSAARRTAEVTVFVAGWMALGLVLRLSPDAYLLAGILLTIAFQRLVAGRPLSTLWLRDARGLRLDAREVTLAAVIGALPAVLFVQAIHSHHLTSALWAAAAILGAGGAAYALCAATRSTGREAVRCVTSAGLVGAGIVALTAAGRTLAGAPLHPSLLAGLRSFAVYFPVCFTLEEVTFRGALDTHLAPAAARRWGSALLVSALWGLWHVPTLAPGSRLMAIPSLLVVHVAIGVPLSFAWRRSGNLAVPALAHALIDGARNGLLGG